MSESTRERFIVKYWDNTHLRLVLGLRVAQLVLSGELEKLFRRLEDVVDGGRVDAVTRYRREAGPGEGIVKLPAHS